MSSRMNPLNAYRETKVKTASQGRLIVMLYEEAIKQLDIAVDLLEKKSRQLDLVNQSITRAQSILAELMSSLNFEQGGDIAKSLFSLYSYFNTQLLDANVRKDPDPIKPVRSFLAELRDAWEQISRMSGPDQPPVERSLNMAT